tara:strand:- start:458 stop:667 length:210 start_codon:yes stop_codon:yes gene_type:complete
MSKWWLVIGCVFLCSGFLLPLGIVILVWYFINSILKNNILNESESNTYAIIQDNVPMNHLGKNVREELK